VPEIRDPYDSDVVSDTNSQTADTPLEPAAPKDMKDFVSR
jgi:hypothetical protein